MEPSAELARTRIARLARQLLRHERRAALLALAPDDAQREIVVSARRIALEGIASHLDALDDDVVRSRCSTLLGLYDSLEPADDADTIQIVVEVLGEIVSSLPPPSVRIGFLRAAG